MQVRAYLDSNLVSEAIIQNELGYYTYTDPRPVINSFSTLSGQEAKAATGFRNANS